MVPASCAHEHREDDGEPFGDAVVDAQYGEDGCRETADRTDRQVELADQQHEDDADRDQTRTHDVHTEVGQVPGREEVRVEALEDDPYREEDEDDRERAQFAGDELVP